MFYLIAGVAAAYTAYTVYQTFFADNNRDEPPPSHPRSAGAARPPVPRHDVQQQWQTYVDNNRDERPPKHFQSAEAARPPVPRHDAQQQWQTIDSPQSDFTPLETSQLLRARASQEGELRSQCYQQGSEAYQRRDHARARALSELGKRHELEMERLHAEASAIIFRENNQDKAAGKVDLHGLRVKEAISYSERAITEARRRGDSEIHLIVGQGTHSDGGVPRLKPAIQKDMQTRGIHARVHPENPGVLIVRLDG